MNGGERRPTARAAGPRRLVAAGAALALALAGCGPRDAGKATPADAPQPRKAGGAELHLYNWNNYLAEETAAKFEEACQCKLV